MAREKRISVRDAEEEGGGEMGSMTEGCVANVITFTSPPDACRMSAVSTLFKSAANSDFVWLRFLPPDYVRLITESESLTSSSSPSLLSLQSKKEIFLSLCDNPILIDGGKKSFSLDKWTGKKCYMIAARDLSIVWACTPRYWSWTFVPEARFPEVAKLNAVCWFEIRGKISTCILSSSTLYTAYLVFKPIKGIDGFKGIPVEVSVGLAGSESKKRSVYLHALRMRQASLPKENDCHPKERGDAWLEVELGDFYNAGDDEGELEISLLEIKKGDWKSGLLVQGIEIRPKKMSSTILRKRKKSRIGGECGTIAGGHELSKTTGNAGARVGCGNDLNSNAFQSAASLCLL